MNRFRTFAASLAAGLALAGSAQAVVVTYTIAGNGSGVFNGSSFSDTDFTIILVGDTDLVQDLGGDASALNALDSATVSIAGLGSGVINVSTRLGLSRSNNAFFFSRSSGSDLFDFYVSESDEQAFDYTAPYGPVSGFDVFALSQFQDVATSGGAISFSSSSDVLFSASTGGAVVPEPATWALMISGFGLAGGALRRRRAATI